MKKFVLTLVFIAPCLLLRAQEKPKLVVGIVVDQMRQEYLYRFEKKFGPGGFKRLMADGFVLKNAHYSYIPTYTGPGHASIYTGATPATHGIIGNDWYDRVAKATVNCVGDDKQKAVGNELAKGAVSPWRMLSTTITDELKLATQKRSIVIGLSLKDRGAVLPAGHLADGAYWFDGPSGAFISSTFYTCDHGFLKIGIITLRQSIIDNIRIHHVCPAVIPGHKITVCCSYISILLHRRRLSGNIGRNLLKIG